jgi:YidC/Oxa1 family membrane protein insertase
MSIFDNNQPGDKRTLIAIVLSVIVIVGSIMIQNLFFPQPSPAPVAPAQTTVPAPNAAPVAAPSGSSPAVSFSSSVETSGPSTTTSAVSPPLAETTYTVQTEQLLATFSNRGGDLVSLKLKKHKDKEGFVDMILPGTSKKAGLTVAFGPPGTEAFTQLMNARWIDDRTIEFYVDLKPQITGGNEAAPFTYKKRYTFREGEYMFGMAISLENSANEYLPLDNAGFSYSVSIGPQIGPRLSSAQKTANSDFRKYITLTAGKKREEKPKDGQALSPKEQPTWVAISGKYFAFIAVPELPSFGTSLYSAPDPSIVRTTTLAIARPTIKASKQTDAYYFYFGPKTNAELAKYDYADRNAFERSGLKLEEAIDTSNILGWLEYILKFFLNIFYKLIPNYGIAIILVTILVKAISFPLTKKGSVASAKMQELQPKMQELQAKYKSNPQKLNQEMAEFYKREGYNPMSGCLPVLIQFPLFIAMYNLFNNHFDLRGASFIPGWISDLSLPEAIFTFPTVNLVIWQISAIRVLPILYVLSQLLYGKFTQTSTGGQSAAQMKLMMYGMPIFFFFILYDVPSGLLVYWIASNVLTILQQIVINDILKKKKTAVAK